MQKEQLIINGKVFLSTRRGAEIAGYSADYVGQLCRSGKIECRRIRRVWFVEKDSILRHSATYANVATRANVTSFKPEDFKRSQPSLISTAFPLLLTSPNAGGVSGMSSGISYNQQSYQKSSNPFSTGIFAVLFVIVLVFSAGTLFMGPLSRNNNGSSSNLIASVSGVMNSIVHDIVGFFTHSTNSTVNGIATGGNSDGSLGNNDSLPVAQAGMVVVPSQGSTSANTKLAGDIINSFSDPVQVKQSVAANSGVITPVFRTVKGNDFMYVLVPVKTATSSATSTN